MTEGASPGRKHLHSAYSAVVCLSTPSPSLTQLDLRHLSSIKPLIRLRIVHSKVETFSTPAADEGQP